MPPRLSLLALVLTLTAVEARALEPISRIADIRALTPESAAEGREVRIEATVTLYDPEVGSFFVSDGVDGIFIVIDRRNRPSPAPFPGDRVRITGRTQPGDFLPNILLTSLERRGSGPPLQPRKITAAELQIAGLDCDWVEFPAIIKGTYLNSSGGVYFDVLAEGWPLKAYVSRAEKYKTPPWQLLERTVRLQCIVATRFNQQRQMCGRQLMAPGLSFIIPEDAEPDLEPGAQRRSTDLLVVDSPPRERVRLRGVVTMLRPGLGFDLRDEGGGLFVQTAQPLDFGVGDVVEAQGFAEMAEFRPKLNAVEVHRLQQGTPPAPLTFDVNAPRNTREQHELVRVDATLLDVLRTPSQIVLRCGEFGGQRFNAALSGPGPLEIEPGARLRLTGICELGSTDASGFGKFPDSFQLQLRTPADAIVLSPAPWWNARHLRWLAAAAGGLAALVALVGLWAVLLKRQVRAQSAIIREQTARTAVLDERHRIARELHDTLEQDLMGVTMLLEDADARLNGASSSAHERLGIARRLLRRSREESRSTIRDLRSVTLEQLGLPTALQETLQPIATAAGLGFEFILSGEVRKLSALAETSLLRIAHEGVSNAVKHACATHICVRLEFAAAEIRLEISDDGQGLAPGDIDQCAGHFGLLGIRERANKLGGSMLMTNRPGGGAALRVVIPAPATLSA